jgi:hypothetical protein
MRCALCGNDLKSQGIRQENNETWCCECDDKVKASKALYEQNENKILNGENNTKHKFDELRLFGKSNNFHKNNKLEVRPKWVFSWFVLTLAGGLIPWFFWFFNWSFLTLSGGILFTLALAFLVYGAISSVFDVSEAIRRAKKELLLGCSFTIVFILLTTSFLGIYLKHLGLS